MHHRDRFARFLKSICFIEPKKNIVVCMQEKQIKYRKIIDLGEAFCKMELCDK